MKKSLLLLATVLLAACDHKSDSSPGTASPSENSSAPAAAPIVDSVVIVTDQTSGNFTVDARSERATFENRSDQPATFVFKGQGEWRFAEGAEPLGASGAASPAPGTFLLPGANSFELVAKRGDGTYTHLGDSMELTLNPYEVISFAMNDIKGGLSDNRGTLTVKWRKKITKQPK